ncbi:MAG: 2-hydroxyacyl-CoA dehydratase family protein [Planctomycetota bacterium]
MAEQFDPRYRLAPSRGDDSRTRRRCLVVEEEARKNLAAIPCRPSNIARFEAWIDGRGIPASAPVVGYFCNFIPVELIHALGARAVRLDCGNAALVQAGEEALSGEICPVAKSSFALFLDAQGLANQCAAVILPASCDAKRKLGEILSDWKPTFALNLPPEQDARRYGKLMAEEMARLASFLEKHLGRRLSNRALLEAIELGRERTALARALLKARMENPAALSIRDLFLMLQASFRGVPLEEWLPEARRVLEEIRSVPCPSRPEGPRLVLTGAPILWPNFKLLGLIEACGAEVAADTLCSGAQGVFDPVVTDERGRTALLRALAERYVFASSCPCFLSQGTRLSRVLDLVGEGRAGGVIHHGLRLCQLFDLEVYRLARVLKDRRVPFLSIRTDYSLEDTEQLRVRIEAFLEQIEAS